MLPEWPTLHDYATSWNGIIITHTQAQAQAQAQLYTRSQIRTHNDYTHHSHSILVRDAMSRPSLSALSHEVR